MFLAVADPLAQVERAQALIERGPLAFVAALGLLSALGAIWLLLRSKDKNAIAALGAENAHSAEKAAIHKEYAEKLERSQASQNERGIKLELILHGLLELSEDFRFLAMEARKRSQREGARAGRPQPTSSPGLTLEAGKSEVK